MVPWRRPGRLLAGCLLGLAGMQPLGQPAQEPAGVAGEQFCSLNGTNGTNATNATNSTNRTNCMNATGKPRLVPAGSRVVFRHRAWNPADSSAVVAMVAEQSESSEDYELKVGEHWGELHLQLEASASTSSPSWLSPHLRFVQGSAAADHHCGEEWVLGDDRVRSPAFFSPGTVALNRSIAKASWEAITPLAFPRAGQAKLCFSHDGNFSVPNAELLRFNLSLLGLLDLCGGTCDLTMQRVECYPQSTGDCSFLFGGAVGNLLNSSTSWTPAFGTIFDNETGAAITSLATVPACGSGQPAIDIFGAGNEQLGTLLVQPSGILGMALPIQRTAEQGPTTVALCYCPDPTDQECTSEVDYTQQVGILLIFTSALCDPSEGTECNTRYGATVVGHRFMVRVFCPPQGCRPEIGSRLKLIARNSTADLPSWDPMNGCRHAPHLESWLPRGNCLTPSSCMQDGGPRQDYRSWGGPGSWWAWEPRQNPRSEWRPELNLGAERADLRVPQDADICFCDGLCSGANARWFKVGELRIAATRLAAGGSLGPAPTLLGAPGSLHLAKSPEDAFALGLARNGSMKLLADPGVNATAEDCNVVQPSGAAPSLSPWHGVLEDGSNRPASPAHIGAFAEGTRIILDIPGVVAVCYCSSPLAGEDCGAGGFILVSRFTVKGPLPGQSFSVSTGGLFHLEFAGFGLEATDTLLLSELPCSTGGVRPLSGTTLVATGCPWACSGAEVGNETPAESIATVLLTHARAGCDDLGGNCRSARITNISSGVSGTELIFESDPGLEQGDRIVIGAGVEGGTSSQLQSLRGRFFFAEAGGNTSSRTYTVAHAVTAGKNSRTWHVPLAFSGPAAPTFTVAYGGAAWARQSRASTQRELLGPANYTGSPPLHVCWSAGTRSAQAWHAVGTLTFEEPPAFPRAVIALVAPISGQAVTAVVAFETGRGAYPVGVHGTAFVLRFRDTARLAPRLISGGLPTVGLSRPAGSQGRCAEVLLETWSSQTDIGFPLPRRCRFGPQYGVGGRTVLEFELQFEPQAGLLPNTKYQLVLNVQVADGVQASEELLHLEATDDLGLRPNSAVEAGRAVLSMGGTSAAGPTGSWLQGLDIVSSTAMTPPGSALQPVTLSGDAPSMSLLFLGNTSGGVAPGSHLRVVLWPLTQWHLGTVASATCDPPYECNPEASPEATEGRVGAQRNSIMLRDLRVKQGASEVPITDVHSPVLTLTCPGRIAGGFFAARPAVVVHDAATLMYQYFRPTSGTAFHKAFVPYASLVSSRGHGDDKPYPFAYNTLYVRLFLPAYLPAGGNLTIESPGFFRECGAAEPLPRARLPNNPLRHPGGTLRQGSWETTSIFMPNFTNRTPLEQIPRTCRWVYTPEYQGGMLAGSAAYLQIAVRNPPFTIHGDNATSLWRVSMYDGHLNISMSANFTVPPALTSGDLTTDIPVIRQMPFAQTMPGSLLPGVAHTLEVFFAVSKTISPAGAVEVWAPQGFDFGSPCTMSDLGDEVYRYGTGPIVAALERIPEPQGCSSQRWPISMPEYTVARVGFGRPALQGRRYAFSLAVRNPHLGKDQQRTAWTQQSTIWAVRAIDETGHVVEAVNGAATFDGLAPGNATESWDLCAEEPVVVPQFRWGTLMPYSITLSTGYVTILPLEFPQDMYVPLRFTAPVGYIWEAPEADRGYWMDYPPGATAPMPGGLPSVFQNIYVQWKRPLLLIKGFRYGFRMPVRIPDWPQTSSAFYLEVGSLGVPYSPQRRPLCSVMPGPEKLRVVREPSVDYLTGRLNEQHYVTISLRTVSILYPGSGFLFVGGVATVRLYCNCPAEEFLAGLECTTLSGQMTGYILFRLVSTTSLRPGEYKFPFWCTNPAFTEEVDTWTLGTYKEPERYPQVVQVDGEAKVPGFALQPGMAHFSRLPAAAASGLDPRSLRRCGTILSFVLTNETGADRTNSSMRLRAPEGTLFQARCLGEVITDPNEIFGAGVPLPGSYAPLPPLHRCEGDRHIAYLHWQMLVMPKVTYAFRVTPLNPLQTPFANVWTLEADGQSSSMVAGIDIQAFGRVTLEFTATGARMPESTIGGNYSNRVRVRFSPTVEARNFTLTAPQGFSFGDHQLCSRLRLLGRSDQMPGGRPSTTFVPRLAACVASGLTLNIVWDESQNWTMTTGALYTLDADILFPAAAAPSSATRVFNFLSTSVTGGFGDEYSVQAPQTWSAPLQFKVTNVPGEIFAPRPVETDVQVAFTSMLLRDDRIELQMPRRFTFDIQRGACPATWQVPAVGPAGSCTCDSATDICKLTFTVRQNFTWPGDSTRLHAPWPPGWPLRFSFFAMNPTAQPTIFENAFVITHFPPVRAHNWTTPYDVGICRGWGLISPVTGLRFSIAAGSNQRAGSVGVLHLTFVPSNDATILRITGVSPNGWILLASAVCLIQEVGQALCRVPRTKAAEPAMFELLNTEIVSGVAYTREIRSTQLPPIGGPTVFTLETFIQDSQGTWLVVDQVERHQSFRLPGLLASADTRLRTTHLAKYPTNLLWAQLPPRLGLAEAGVFWRFSLSQSAVRGDWLAIQVVLAGTMELDTHYTGITVLALHPDEPDTIKVGDIVPFDAEQVSNTEVHLRLRAPLRVNPAEYRAYVSGRVLQNLQANGGQGATKFLNVSLCRKNEPLPIATNDAVPSGGGKLPEEHWTVTNQLPDFQINAMGVAPMAQIMISGYSPSSLDYPTVTLVAPYGVNILDPCFPSACASVSRDFSGSGHQAAVRLVTTGDFSLRVQLPRSWEDGSWVALTPRMSGPDDNQGSAVAASLWHRSDVVEFRQMPTGMVYPAIGSVQGARMTLNFRPGIGAAQVLSSGTKCFVRVHVPEGYRIRCSTFFRTITLPVLTQAFCEEEPGASRARVTISAPDAMRLQSAEDIMFAFGLEVPAETPVRNLFEVVLLTPLNVTVDSNTAVPGMPIPAQRLRSSVVLKVSGFENLAWLQAWVVSAQQSGVLATGLARALAVLPSTVAVERAEARLRSSRRRLEEEPSVRALVEASPLGEIAVNFTTALRLAAGHESSEAVLRARFREAGLAAEAAVGISAAASEAGLAALAIGDTTVTRPGLVIPPNVTSPSLRWTAARPGGPCRVSVGLVFRAKTRAVRTLLFLMPVGFTHELQTLSDLRVTLNGAAHDFPVASKWGNAYIDARTPHALRITAAEGAQIQTGGYAFDFPARVPEEVPVLNIWRVCLCSSKECDSVEHPSVITVFVIPGFRIGEAFPVLSVPAGAWKRSLPGLAAAFAAFAAAFSQAA